MPKQITVDMVVPYLTGTSTYIAKKESENDYLELKIHMDGEYPEKLIDERRPSEPAHIKDYRKKIFQHVSMPIILKCVSAFGRIRKSSDWSIKYDSSAVLPGIAKGEDAQSYFEKNFPVFGSVTKWAFDVMLKQYLTDANGVVAVLPREFSQASNQYHKPFPYIFNSDNVVQFAEGEYCILKTHDTIEITLENGSKFKKEKFIVLTTYSYEEWIQGADGKWRMNFDFQHGFGELPAFKMGGLSKTTKEGSFIWRSRIYPMVPRLNEAVREYTDLQAGVVQHLFLKEWEYESQKCGTCKGVGKVNKADGGSVKCPEKNCKGGILISSPYEKTVVRPSLPGSPPVPMPPGGYFDRNPEIIKIQDERIDKHEFKALSAINMEYLSKTPLSESGTAKQVDREETNTFVYGIAEDIVGIMDKCYYYMALWRYYPYVSNDKEVIKTQLPKIPVPEKYDLFTSAVLMDEISSARNAKINPTTISAMEREYVQKKFGYDAEKMNECDLILSLDPLPGYAPDEKSAMLFNKGITETDFIISCNINTFVKRAMQEDSGFSTKPVKEQLVVLEKYASEKSKANLEGEKLKIKLQKEAAAASGAFQ